MIIGGYHINERYVTAEVTVNEAEERVVHLCATPDPDFNEPPCPTCGAVEGDHCTTASGTKRGRHATRHDRLDYRRRLVDDRHDYARRHGVVLPDEYGEAWAFVDRHWFQRDPFGEAVAWACHGSTTVIAPSAHRLRFRWEYRVEPSQHGALVTATVEDVGGSFRWEACWYGGVIGDAGYAPTLDEAKRAAEDAAEAMVGAGVKADGA